MMFHRETDFSQTPIGNIPKGWQVAKLVEIVKINGESCDPSREFPADRFLYVDIESVEGGSGKIKEAKKILGKEAPSRARRVIHKNDVLMSTVRPYLKAFALVPNEYEDGICSTGFAVLTAKEEMDPRYLLYSLFSDTVISQCNRMMVGGQYPALNSSQVSEIQLPIPPLSEQRRIVGVLDVVDSAIELADKVIAKTERLKKGLMKKLLTEGIGHKEFKDTEIGRIPKTWAVKTLIDAAGGKDDLIVAGPFGSNLKVIDYRDEGVPIIRLQNIDYGKFANKDIKYTSFEKAEELSYHSFIKGDIVLAKLGDPIGKTCIVPDFLEKGIVVADVVRIRIDERMADKRYIMQVLNSTIISSQLTRGIIGTTRPRVNINQVRELLLPVPPLPEQNKIADILTCADKKAELEIKQKTKLERVKHGLMDLLLIGKIRVKVD